MEEKEISNAIERYNFVREIAKKDNVVASFLDRLVDCAARYVGVTATMKAQNLAFKYSENCREDKGISELDKSRRIHHEALVSTLNVLNRYLFKNYKGKIPAGGIYSLARDSIKDRHSVGTWAGNLVFGLKGEGKT